MYSAGAKTKECNVSHELQGSEKIGCDLDAKANRRLSRWLWNWKGRIPDPKSDEIG